MKALLLTAGLIVSLIPQVLIAHVSTTDTTVSGVLHIDPGDQAYTGKTFGLQIQIEDTARSFSINECGCHVDIYDESGKIFTSSTSTEKLFGSDTIRVNYEFPHEGTYTLMLHGNTPDFSLHFIVPVRKGSEVSILAPYYHIVVHHSSHLIVFGFGFIAAGIVLLRNEK